MDHRQALSMEARAGGERERAAALHDVERLSRLLDTRWHIPGTGIRFGIDPLIGLVPGLGDAATGLVSAYIIVRAAKVGLPSHVVASMVGNVLLDVIVGSIPVLGSVFDLFFKANRRNLKLLQRHLARAHRP